MKILIPLVIALLGLGAGVGVGLALKPEPPSTACADAAEHPCEAEDAAAHEPSGDLDYAVIDKPFVVPIFHDGHVTAMVVLSLSLSLEHSDEAGSAVKTAEPRLRDGFLKVMFRHANSGGFDGSFTTGQKMDDLKSALLASAREILPATPLGAVLITEIARQDMG